MSQLIVYKASAGSGKTYRLACEYIKQVIVSPESYRSILAVTFTNKATAEMKGRIVDELFNLSQGQKSAMANEIASELGFSFEIICLRAKKALSLILHDYSLFSISTIDSFVQRVVQALLWEIGEQGGAEIQLDTEPILSHAADNLLDSASHYDELMRWLSIMGENLMEEGGTWDVRKRLISLGQQIFSESFRLMDSKEIELLTGRKNVEDLKVKLQRYLKETLSFIKEIAQDSLAEVDRSGVDIDLFKNKQRGIIGFFIKCKEIESNEKTITDEFPVSVSSSIADSTGDAWVNKETSKNIAVFGQVQSLVQRTLHPNLVELVEYFNTNRRAFISAKLILKNLENLALIGDLWREVRELSKQEGVLLLSDSGHLLREFVKDTDAPFVYEKIGNRYDSFMIDEFQDTSVVQWHNFKPLIDNSLSQDSFSMLVGDVKQSIYRWRNGDWRILSEGVNNDFSHHGVHELPLNTNWRSMPVIVNFNNSFFESAILCATEKIKERLVAFDPNLSEKLALQVTNAYSDVKQFSREGLPENAGYVEVNFIESKRNEEYDQKLSNHLPQQIVSLISRYKPGEIAVLVRTKSDGQRVANMIIEHNRNNTDPKKNVHFMSQEGLYLKSSGVIHLLISAFRLIQTPSDPINQRVLSKALQLVSGSNTTNWHKVFSNEYLKDEINWLTSLGTLTLQECFDSVVSRFKLSEIKGELAYLAELHEVILAQSARGNADVNRFLEWWDDNQDNLSLSVPESPNAISIITIHKSKGLEFPVVIIPYANWSFRVSSKPPLLWVSSTVEPFNTLPRYPIYSTANAEESLFALEAHEEKVKELVDNLNMLYVAFTRAKNELYINSPLQKSEKKGKDISSITDLMQAVMLDSENQNFGFENITYDEGIRTFKSGAVSDFRVFDVNKIEEVNYWKLDRYGVGAKTLEIKLKKDSLDFFKSLPAEKLTPLEHGKIMHQLFSLILNINQVEDAVSKLVTEGLIGKSDGELLQQQVKQILKEQPFCNWFTEDWIIKTEASILTPEGQTYRPDRVMINDEKTIVVDFKFGVESGNHRKQLSQYASLLKKMGYRNVESYLWYVDQGKIIKLAESA